METIESVAKKYFGFDTFRPKQKTAIERILTGKTYLLIFPTSFGKSSLYLISGLMTEGLTIIVTPTLSLIEDQYSKLKEKDISVARLDSSIKNKSKVLDNLSSFKFLYLTPEQLISKVFLSSIRETKIARLVVDECHCLVSWGFSFRKAYLKIPYSYDALGRPQVIAMTATITKDIEREIKKYLQLKTPGRLCQNLIRKNISINVKSVESFEDKVFEISSILDDRFGKKGIIYCSTIKECNKLIENFPDHNKDKYYGLLSNKRKKDVFDGFKSGDFNVLITTSSFGLGIDLPVDYVIVANAVSSLEEYYQMIGRAGRFSNGESFFLSEDRDFKIQQYFINVNFPKRQIVEDVYYLCLCKEAIEINPAAVLLKHDPLEIHSALVFLKGEGFINYVKHGENFLHICRNKYNKVLFVNWSYISQKREFRETGVKKMKEYFDYDGCYNNYLNMYFHEKELKKPCGTCENCLT